MTKSEKFSADLKRIKKANRSAVNAFLNEEDDCAALGQDDWKRIKDEVGYEAENLPLDLLSQMMQTIVSKNAF